MNKKSQISLRSILTMLLALIMAVAIIPAAGTFASQDDADDDGDTAGGRVILTDEDIAFVEDYISRNAMNESKAWTSNSISGITISRAVSATGIISFTPPKGNGGIIWSDDWSYFYTYNISDIHTGDVIAFPEDEAEGMFINHIGVVSEADEQHGRWIKTADGNYTSETGIHVTYRTTLSKRSSNEDGPIVYPVCVWRNKKAAYDIADSAFEFSRNIINTHDTSIMDEYDRMGMNWCNCYATEVLLHVTAHKGSITIKNNLNESSPREFIMTLTNDVTGKAVNGTYSGCQFVNGTYKFTLAPGAALKIGDMPNGLAYTVKAAAGDIPRSYKGHVRGVNSPVVNVTSFSDVRDSSSSAFIPIYWAAEEDVIRGYSDGTFRPQNNCTRGQFVTMLWRYMGRKDVEGTARTFKDVNSNMSSYRAIQWASSIGLIKGYNDGTFRPDENLTRGQIITILWRMNEKAEPENAAPFKDVSRSMSSYKAIAWGSEEGVIKGYDDGTFRPDNYCTRAQIVTILYRADRENII